LSKQEKKKSLAKLSIAIANKIVAIQERSLCTISSTVWLC